MVYIAWKSQYVSNTFCIMMKLKNCLLLWIAAPEQNVDHSFYPSDSLKLFEKNHIIVLPACHNNNNRKFDPDIYQARYVLGPNVLNNSLSSHTTAISLGLSSPCEASMEGMPPSDPLLSTLLSICITICHTAVTLQPLFDALLTHLLWATKGLFSRVQRQVIKSKPRRWHCNISEE